jgi:hypothetical protein
MNRLRFAVALLIVATSAQTARSEMLSYQWSGTVTGGYTNIVSPGGGSVTGPFIPVGTKITGSLLYDTTNLQPSTPSQIAPSAAFLSSGGISTQAGALNLNTTGSLLIDLSGNYAPQPGEAANITTFSARLASPAIPGFPADTGFIGLSFTNTLPTPFSLAPPNPLAFQNYDSRAFLIGLAFMDPTGLSYGDASVEGTVDGVAPVTQAPEPSTYLLLGLGVIALLGRQGWRRLAQLVRPARARASWGGRVALCAHPGR